MIPPLSGGKHWSRWLLWLAVIGGMVHLLATGFRTFSRPGTQPDFEVVRSAVAQSLRQQSYATALRQYLSLLAGQARVDGIDLDAADTPLVQ